MTRAKRPDTIKEIAGFQTTDGHVYVDRAAALKAQAGINLQDSWDEDMSYGECCSVTEVLAWVEKNRDQIEQYLTPSSKI
jgi:hypothetical protein